MPHNEPSERQLSYAKKLGIRIPAGATKHQVSDLIDIKLGCDKWAPDWLKTYAAGKLERFDPAEAISEKRLMKWIFPHLDRETAAAWFCFWVYRDIASARSAALVTPDHDVLKEIGAEMARDPKVMKSVNGYSGHSLLHFGTWSVPDGCNLEDGGSRRTIAYKTAVSLLSGRLPV